MDTQLGKICGAGKSFRLLKRLFTACSMAPSYAMSMKMRMRIAMAGVLGLLAAGEFPPSATLGLAPFAPAASAREPNGQGGRGGPGGEQDAARQAMLDGRVMPFSVIKRRIEKAMGDATYLGSEFHTQSNRYRLKYVRDGRVVWVDVDGRTGDIAGWAH